MMKLWNLFRHPGELIDLTPEEVQTLSVVRSTLAILDVRTKLEYKSGHIPGAASYPLGN